MDTEISRTHCLITHLVVVLDNADSRSPPNYGVEVGSYLTANILHVARMDSDTRWPRVMVDLGTSVPRARRDRGHKCCWTGALRSDGGRLTLTCGAKARHTIL